MAERARLVNGDFEVDAKPGRGTTLKLRVPA
jgi:signal transduction histidine kinase